MNHRIFSRVVYRAFMSSVAASALCCSQASAQDGSGYYTDPSSGIVYRKVTRSVDRPVVETKVETQNQTVYRPEMVTETKPESRTVYTPVTEYAWEPRVHDRWNPFRRPTVQYHHIGYTRWEPRNEVVQRTQSRTEWVPETRTVEVPKQIVRMEREEKVGYEPVGMVAPQQAAPASDVSSAIASRLRPLSSNERVQPMATSPGFSRPFRHPASPTTR